MLIVSEIDFKTNLTKLLALFLIFYTILFSALKEFDNGETRHDGLASANYKIFVVQRCSYTL